MVQKRFVFIFVILFAFILFSFGCGRETQIDSVDSGEILTPKDTSVSAVKDVGGLKTDVKIDVKNDVVNISTPMDKCVEEWICLNAKSKIYRSGNCSFIKREECKFGCKNNTCAPAPKCTVGWNCDGNYYRGYRLESCEFTKKEKCDFGCKDSECLAEPNVTVTGTATSEMKTQDVKPALFTISVGESAVISGHNVSIYTMSGTIVMLVVDGKKSDWLKEGETFTRNGFNLVIEEILFQEYGTKQISYSVK